MQSYANNNKYFYLYVFSRPRIFHTCAFSYEADFIISFTSLLVQLQNNRTRLFLSTLSSTRMCGFCPICPLIMPLYTSLSHSKKTEYRMK